MKSLHIHCVPCDQPLAELETDSSSIIEAVMIACHSSHPHNRHELRFTLEGAEIVPISQLSSYRELIVKCTLCGDPARNNPKDKYESHYHVLPELIGACTIAHHTAHEGHPMEIWWDGRKIHPTI